MTIQLVLKNSSNNIVDSCLLSFSSTADIDLLNRTLRNLICSDDANWRCHFKMNESMSLVIGNCDTTWSEYVITMTETGLFTHLYFLKFIDYNFVKDCIDFALEQAENSMRNPLDIIKYEYVKMCIEKNYMPMVKFTEDRAWSIYITTDSKLKRRTLYGYSRIIKKIKARKILGINVLSGVEKKNECRDDKIKMASEHKRLIVI